MNESILSDMYSRFKNLRKNEYSKDIPLDHFLVTQQELKNMNIKFDIVKEKNKDRLYIHDKGKRIFRYTKSFYPNNTSFGFQVANDKILTERYLSYANIKTTNSKLFTVDEYDIAFEYVMNCKKKLVIKPLALDGGLGVFIDITPSNFDYFWNECISAQNRRKVKNPKIILQDFIPGFEVRMIINEGAFMSATLRVPAHVRGDGKHSIKELIKMKNTERKKNPLLKSHPIKINNGLVQLLKYKKLKLEDILSNEEFCILYPQSNLQHGGENIEISNLINEEVKQQSVDAVTAIPGLHTSGVDIMLENFDSVQGTIIEVNKAPAFLLNYYPYIGKPQNPMKYIFKSLIIESRILRNILDIKELDDLDLNILINRFKYNYLKQQRLEKTIQKLETENEKLRRLVK